MRLSVFFAHIKQMAREEEISLESAMLTAKGFGFEAVEIDWRDAADAPSEFLLTVEACGMKISSAYGFIGLLSEGGLDEAKRFVDCAARLGAGNAMIMPGEATSVDSREAYRASLVKPLTGLASMAKGLGTSLSIEDYSRLAAPYSLTGDFTYLLANVPNLCFTLDTGNFAYNSEDPYDALRALTPECLRLSHVHLKDYLIEKPGGPRAAAGEKPENRASSGDFIFPCPVTGVGSMPIKKILAYLERYSYSGYMSVESFGVTPMKRALESSAKWISGQLS